MQFAAQIGGWWRRLPYRIFGTVSNFGYWIARPAWWLLAVVTVPVSVYTLMFAERKLASGAGQPLLQAMGLSFANTFSFLGF